jgi:Mrp family chromosome partitioning ATPase
LAPKRSANNRKFSRLFVSTRKNTFFSFLYQKEITLFKYFVFACGERMEATGTEAAKKKVVIVMGSTGVGKSQLAIDLALALAKQEGHVAGAEVINADSMQVYRGFPIATAKGTTPTLHFLTKY